MPTSKPLSAQDRMWEAQARMFDAQADHFAAEDWWLNSEDALRLGFVDEIG